ncbi:hypothetical protein WT60_04650 [Burkholderia sp. MSMB617WGS]|uniref:Uncharacterized protein n=1 Tax=Burkholderia savannae TaxID=1637837 RepID=A0ABR5TB28_9BURK|nr:hypothetical protein WS86_04675 [Burkholderia savannae]AOK46221.1 hypothetical protein WT60_04650 [Burkholderia sp. MSMB617WGS]KWZ42193.1 hypothetical protein WS72_04380 [Burkholderia savannae]KWZ45261.1 hypothetical protein WS73_13720 [Burkholderia savannae]
MLGPRADRDAASRDAARRLREMMRDVRRPGIGPDANRRAADRNPSAARLAAPPRRNAARRRARPLRRMRPHRPAPGHAFDR